MNKNDIDKDKVVNDLLKKKQSLDEFTSEMKNIDVYVVQPNQVVTAELRTNKTRFFPVVKDDIVVGGNFG